MGSPLPPQTASYAMSAFFCSALVYFPVLGFAFRVQPALPTETAHCRAAIPPGMFLNEFLNFSEIPFPPRLIRKTIVISWSC